MELEQWKPIEDYEDYYMVSNFGRIYSIRNEIMLKQTVDTKGYLRVNLSTPNKRNNARVHRLVANAFIPNNENLPHINHKDECKTNNYADNLEWCDASYNNSYGTKLERTAKSNREKEKMKIGRYDLDGNLIKVYNGYNEVKEDGFSMGTVSNCCNGKKYFNTHKGYNWEFIKT